MIINNYRLLEAIEEKDLKYIEKNGTIGIPNNVCEIGNNAFYQAIFLHEIIIPDSVIEIGDYAFRSCDSLKSVLIPKSVKEIGEGAFLSFGELKIYCEVEEKPIGWDSNWNHNNKPLIWGYKGKENGN